MSPSTPPASVDAEPNRRQVVQTYRIPVLVGGEEAVIPGVLEYRPPPSPWPYVAAIALLGLIGAALALRLGARGATWVARASAGLGRGAGAALLVSDALSAPRAGLTAGTGEALDPLVQAGFWIVASAGLLALWWRSSRSSKAGEAVVMLMATGVIAGVAGLGRISFLDHAVIPGAIPADLARLLVVVCLASLPVPAAYAWRRLSRLRVESRGRIGDVALTRGG